MAPMEIALAESRRLPRGFHFLGGHNDASMLRGALGMGRKLIEAHDRTYRLGETCMTTSSNDSRFSRRIRAFSKMSLIGSELDPNWSVRDEITQIKTMFNVVARTALFETGILGHRWGDEDFCQS